MSSAAKAPSVWIKGRAAVFRRENEGVHLKLALHVVAACCVLAGCGSAPSVSPPSSTVPEDVQAAAESLLGSQSQVLLFGDLAKTGKQQFLAANVVPKTPKNNDIAGTIVTRLVIAENRDGKWLEILRCDEHIKNPKGFLPGSPIASIGGWRLQFEQDPGKGLALYLTPITGNLDSHVTPISVRWNPETQRYQSLDRSYEHFLLESPSVGAAARSKLR